MKLSLDISWPWAKAKSLSSLASAWLRGSDGGEGGGVQLQNAYQQSVWVYACVRAIADQLANTEFKLTNTRGQGENHVESGPLWELFQQPHPQADRFIFWELVVSWLQLRGECFVVPMTLAGEVVDLAGAGGRGAKPQQFALLDPMSFRPDLVGGHLLGWHYISQDPQALTGSRYFLPSELIHVRLPNPFDFHRGMSPVSVCRVAAQADYAAAQFHKGLMLNNADTGTIVTTDQQLSTDQAEQMNALLRERKRQAGTADRPVFLWGGAKLEKPAISSADMQFLENRKFSRQEICATFKVPQEVIGYTEDANRSVGQSSRLNFIENTCEPMGARLASAFRPVISAFGPDLIGYFDFDDLEPKQAARLARVDTAVKVWEMGVPFNELNDKLDLGFTPMPWGDKGYLPFSVQEAGVTPPEPTPPTDAAGAGDGEGAALRKALAILERRDPKTQDPIRQTLPPHVCKGSAEYEASIAGAVRLARDKVSKFFYAQRVRALQALEKQRAATAEQRAANSRALGDDIFNRANENELLKGTMRPIIISDLAFGGAQLWKEFDLGSFILPPKAATDYLLKAGTRWEEINGFTHTNLRETLAEGITAGESFDQLADRVRSVFDDAQGFRADTIALTETNTAINAGRNEGLMQSPIDLKVWLSANLENSRAAHQEAGQRYAAGIPKDEPFILQDGTKLMFPGDTELGAGPGQTINCKCHLAGRSSLRAIGAAAKTGAPAEGRLLTWQEFKATQ